ncbi:MAG TPA: hypothetical protein VMT69_04330 [Kineosporiaceae bacterium]|nr:hypothetical protein [Kineosporiaceae bacterium]
MPTARLDHDSRSSTTAASGAAHTSRPSPAEVFVDRGPGYARISGGVCHAEADTDVVGS